MFAALLLLPLSSLAAGQSSASYEIVADVYCGANANVGAGSASYQMSRSVAQFSVVNQESAGGTFALQPGYQATTEGFDSDGDGTVDETDPDTDGDGIPDTTDGTPYDFDADGDNNVTDPDDDDDGLSDADEAGFGTSHLNPNTDGDPHNDNEEWIAGTSGTDSNSYFQVDLIDRANFDTVTVECQGVAGRTYTLGAATNLLGTSVTWAAQGATNVTAPGTVTFTSPADAALRYYQLTVEQTP